MTKFLVRIFIKNSSSIDDPEVRRNYGVLAGTVGIICNLLLFVVKFITGLITGAISITADAFNNLSDAGSSIITLIGFQVAGKPADENHPFGHGRVEYVTGFLVSLAILLMGFELLKSSFSEIFHPTETIINPVSVGILILSILLKVWLSGFNHILGKKLDSSSMRATATDSLSDCFATASVLTGLVVSRFTGYHLDGFMGLIVALFILYAGYSAAIDTISPLIGQKPDPKLVRKIADIIMSEKEILGYHDLVIHNYGPGCVMVSVHVELDAGMILQDAHNVVDGVESEIKKREGCNVTIHMDPVVTDDEETDQLKDLVLTILNYISEDLSMHDFQVRKERNLKILSFDIVIPYEFELTDEDVLEEVDQKIREKSSLYRTEIDIDHNTVL